MAFFAAIDRILTHGLKSVSAEELKVICAEAGVSVEELKRCYLGLRGVSKARSRREILTPTNGKCGRRRYL